MNNLQRLVAFLMVPVGSLACDEGRSSQDDGLLTSDELIPRGAGQTGDEGAKPWRPRGSDGESACPLRETTESLMSLDDDTKLGFSPKDILDLVTENQVTRVRWNASPAMPEFTGYEVQVTPGDLEENVTMTLNHDGSLPSYRGSVGDNHDAGASSCPRGQLELNVTMDISSESGAFNERWWGTLTASDVDEAVVVLQAPTWRGTLPNQPDRDQGNFVNELEGNLDAIDSLDSGSEFAWVYLVLRLRENAIDGSVNGWIQRSDGGAFRLPQTSASDMEGWVGVVGEGFFEFVGSDE